MDEAPYAIVDLETTGFSPHLGDRIIEIAILRVNRDGRTEDEYVTLVNPLRPVGNSYAHGITDDDVSRAPTFAEVKGDVLDRLREAILVAHNARFDRDFLAAELTMAGVMAPGVPTLCTLKLAYRLFPGLANHQLASCCAAAGFAHARCHVAIEDARATARLLSHCLRQAEARGWSTLRALGCAPLRFAGEWPSAPATGRRAVRTSDGRVQGDVPFLARLVASLGPVGGENERWAPYLDVLDRALEDLQVTKEEAVGLQVVAKDLGLAREEVLGAHHAYLESLVKTAAEDLKITDVERRDLEAVARLIAVDRAVLDGFIDGAFERPEE